MPLFPLGLNPFRESLNATAERRRCLRVGCQGTQERESMMEIPGISPSAGSAGAQAQRLFPVMAGFRVCCKSLLDFGGGKPLRSLIQFSLVAEQCGL